MINKNWIESHLFTKEKNRLNNRIYDQIWWTRNNFSNQYDWLINTYDGPGNLFQKLYHIYHEMSIEIPTCKCGNHLKFRQFGKGYTQYCSVKCSYGDPERNEKIGSNRNIISIMAKVKETNLMKYGTETYLQTNEFKKKSSSTKKKRYGNENYNNWQKSVNTNLERYGVQYGFQQEHVRKKILKHGTKGIMPTKNELIELNTLQKISVINIAEQYDVTPKTIRDWSKKLGVELINFTPEYQQLQRSFAQSLPVGFIENDRRTIKPKELDIHYIDKRLAIEVNGLYWHRDDKKRHLEKLNLCIEKDIRLMQFWDYEIIESPKVVLSIISGALGMNNRIFARKCEIREIDNKTYSDFLEHNHLQGYRQSKIRFGLFYHDELISVIGLSKPRFNSNYDLEIIRHATKLNTTVIGGLSKFVKHLPKNMNIISYVDRRIFTGNGYQNSGFEFVENTTPNYVWFNKNTRYSRYQTQKHKLSNLLGNEFDSNLSESQNMFNAGYDQVFDCGNSIWKYHT